MSKVKIFKLDQEQEDDINDFLDIIDNGQITIQRDKVVVIYEGQEETGMTKDQALRFIGSEIIKAQQQVISHELNKRFWKSQDLLSSGGKEKQRVVSQNCKKAITNVENAQKRLKHLIDMYKEAEKEKLDSIKTLLDLKIKVGDTGGNNKK